LTGAEGPVYGWFTEGFDTLDLRQAKALFGELAQNDYWDAAGPELKEAWTALASARCCCKIGSALEATVIIVWLCAFDFSDWNLLTAFS
jgi:hypothetical protein